MPSLLGPQLIHLGTGRSARIVRAERLDAADPVVRTKEKYVLFTASEQTKAEIPVLLARRWLEGGAAYVCSWGQSSSDIEDTFDHASFLPELGEPLAYTIMTTSHPNETLEEALWFAFWNAGASDDHLDPESAVVVLLDSGSLEARCQEWIKTNRE